MLGERYSAERLRVVVQAEEGVGGGFDHKFFGSGKLMLRSVAWPYL